MSKNQTVKIRLTSYFQEAVNRSARLITEMVKRTGAIVKGPILLPTRKKKFTVLSSPNVDKDARDQYEISEHKRLLIIEEISSDTRNVLQKIELPPEVFIFISQ